jgi:sulfur relay (sulfurtransferase) DsrF/TusC family protein
VIKPNVLVIVTDDPRVSARPAEAIRIVAGVGAWERMRIHLYLRDAAVLALSEYPDELVDSENYSRYLPMLSAADQAIYVQHGAPSLVNLGRASRSFEEISDRQLADLAANSDYVLRF